MNICTDDEQQEILVDEEKSAGRKPKKSRTGRQSVGEAFIKSAARSIGSQIGRQLIRGILGSLLGSRRR